MENTSPLQVLDIWDFITICLSVGMRFLVDLSIHVNKGDIKEYFGKTSVKIQWTLHMFSVLALMIVLPTWVVSANHGLKYLSNWEYIGTLIVGFGGFDAIRFVWNKIQYVIDKVVEKKAQIIKSKLFSGKDGDKG